MKLKTLTLHNFRSYKKHFYEFPEDKDLLILVGPNGTGKTNFLEAIYLLSLGKSFRSLLHDDLITWDGEFLRCIAELETSSNSKSPDLTKLEVFYSTTPHRHKNFKKNGVNLRNTEYLGNLLTVLFHPEDLNMLYLEPGLRRRYLDIVLSQTDRKYLAALSKYKKVVKQRNALLKMMGKNYFPNQTADFQSQSSKVIPGDTFASSHAGYPDDFSLDQFSDQSSNLTSVNLAAWDQELVEFGSVLIEKRLYFVEFLNQKLQKIYQSITDSNEKIEVQYSSEIFSRSEQSLSGSGSFHQSATTDHTLTNPSNTSSIPTLFSSTLSIRQQRDIFQGTTTSGPHRDDLIFKINNKNICSSASRGEFRTMLLALKLAEIDFIKEKTGKNPILLLDDVFSELDRKRQTHLLKSIKGCQTIITTTDLSQELANLDCIIHRHSPN